MIQPIRTLPLTEVPLAEACAALDAGYEGYVVPVRFDPPALVRRMLAEHIDLAASHLILAPDGGTAGILLVARRGRDARIAAVGIVPALRGAGLGAAAIALAIAEAEARGDARLLLEVISSNAAAIATYRRAGFVDRRSLVGYAHDPVAPAEAALPVEPAAPAGILPLLHAAWPGDPSWQTAPLSFVAATAPVTALRTPDGEAAALVDASGETARLLALAVAPGARGRGLGRRFLEAVLAAHPGKSWAITATLPEDQAGGFLQATGWRRTPLSQIEMERPLTPRPATRR